MSLRVGSPFVRWFASIGIADRSTVGSKGGSLGELDRAGTRVPSGFVITSAAFERMLAALDTTGSIRTRIARLDSQDLPGIRNACADIRHRIEEALLPTELHAMLVEAYRELNDREHDVPVAVRSSATIDDAADVSRRSLQETFLWVRGIEGISYCVRSCWASLFSVEAVVHRLRLKVPERTVSMGVIVQRMVNAHCAGVMSTRNRATGDRNLISIEGTWGMGSAISSGEVTPDRFLVSKVTGEIVQRNVAEKVTQHLPDTIAGGVRREPVPDELRSVSCLTDAQIIELAQVARKVERHYGSAQEIEWAIVEGERGVYLLQSRAEAAETTRDVRPVATSHVKDQDPVVSLLSGRQR
jgi:pyruvate,water dikinase